MAETDIDTSPGDLAAPILSVLIPFLNDDPTGLIEALGRQEGAAADAIELVAFDDGGADAALAERARAAIEASPLPGHLIRSPINLGRARGRNRLARAARGEWLLFIDADMRPDSPRFLATYLELIAAYAPPVAFGGLSLDQAPPRREHALHRRMALATDCPSAEQRRKAPEKHVFTSNLLVRRGAFDEDSFDEGFCGWGWEDVEWAIRIGRRHPILHIANTATHLGLDTPADMARKYEQSAANFARVVRDHRQIVEAYPSYRVARLLRRVPLRRAWRPWLKAVALAEAAPLAARALAMRLYRAALYAEAV